MLCVGKEIGMREVIYNFSFEKYPQKKIKKMRSWTYTEIVMVLTSLQQKNVFFIKILFAKRVH